MICKRCGKEIADDAVRCPSCGIKVRMYCPCCNTLNNFGNTNCTACNFELLIKCPECNSSNMYYATECRKCKTPLKKSQSAKTTSQNRTFGDTGKKFKLKTGSTQISPKQAQPTVSDKKSIKFVSTDNLTKNEIKNAKSVPYPQDKTITDDNKPIKVSNENENNNFTKQSECAEIEGNMQTAPVKLRKTTEGSIELKNADDSKKFDNTDFSHVSEEENAKVTEKTQDATTETECESNNESSLIETENEINNNIDSAEKTQDATTETECESNNESPLIETENEINNNIDSAEKTQDATTETKCGSNNESPLIETENEINNNIDSAEKTQDATTKTECESNKESSLIETKNEINNNIDSAEKTEISPEEEFSDNEIIDESIAELCKEDEPVEILAEEEINEDEKTDKEEVEAALPNIQEETLNLATGLIKNSSEKKIIGICGGEENGKSIVLKRISEQLSAEDYFIFRGSCTPLLQITAFGFFQDVFLRMFGFPPYINDIDVFKQDFKNSPLGAQFGFLTENELNLFLNIFYPEERDCFENINRNKTIMFSILEKIIKTMLMTNNILIVADNFELMDGASYDFITYILKKGFFGNRLKLLVGYSENREIVSYFDTTDNTAKIFETISLPDYTREDLIRSVSYSLGFPLEEVFPENYINELIDNSDGNSCITEQEAALLFDSGYISLEGDDVVINTELKPESKKYTLEELVKLRIQSLTPAAKNILFMAAIMGFRFAPSVLCVSVDITQDKSEQIINFLLQELFIVKVDNYTCEFRTLDLWKIIYAEAKSDLLYKENAKKLYDNLKFLTLSSNIQKVISCADALSPAEAYEIWEDTSQLAAKSGDTNLFIISKKQMLKLLDEIEPDNADELKINIYEETGKLLYEKSPEEAITYLSNVADDAVSTKKVNKLIDITSYLAVACNKIGNYYGVCEAIDTLTEILSDEAYTDDITALDSAMIKSRKLNALFNMGNCGQITEVAEEEILPVLEEYADTDIKSPTYSPQIINEILNTKITLAKTYALQGNKRVFELIDELKSLTTKFKIRREYYISQTEIIEAFAETVHGEINTSNEILNEIATRYKDKVINPKILAQWNIINILNRILTGQYENLKSDLFELATFTNNINEPFLKNIAKLILGFMIKKEGNILKALEIFNKQITYFAKEKTATGALASWLLVMQISAEAKEYDKATGTATKALEIAQSSKIDNRIFALYFQKALAELYLQNGDAGTSKMYLEQAFDIAEENEMKYQLIELYIDYGKYYEKTLGEEEIKEIQNVKTIFELYNKAADIARELQLPNMLDAATREHNNFKTFCRLNSIPM